ncbi:hypothetical protein I4U23_005830 [Adineta vaga]|nr:hypothetical protein I4U23_005830 [Adineta vaga]
MASNTDNQLQCLRMIRLVKALSNNESTREKMKSGLVKISTVKGFTNIMERLKIDFQSCICVSSLREAVDNTSLQQMQIISAEYDDVDKCIHDIESSIDNNVVLLLFDHHVNNINIVPQLRLLSNVKKIYRCLFEHEPNEPESSLDTPSKILIQNLDFSGLMALTHVFFIDLARDIPQSNQTIEDFINYCQLLYKDRPNYSNYREQMKHFKANYGQNKALTWYTMPDSFISRIVCRTCATLDFKALPKVSFLLYDLYTQLKQLHARQIESNKLQSGFFVYRGAKISETELSQFNNEGNLFVTRSFLSTSTNGRVANIYGGEQLDPHDGIPVMFRIRIDYVNIHDKPIAYLDEISSIPDEEEVMLPMGIVLRLKSCKENEDDSNYVWDIEMIRGEDEANLDKDPTEFVNLINAESNYLFLVESIFSPITNDNQLFVELLNSTPSPADTSAGPITTQMNFIYNIRDITYDSHLYSQVDPWVLILEQRDESWTRFPFYSTKSIKFLQYFDSITTCQGYIRNNPTHQFTLFVSEDCICTWIYNNSPIPNNLKDIIVYGGNSGRMFKVWARRYTKNIREVLTFGQFEQYLLTFGLNHVLNAANHFTSDFGVLNLLKNDFEDICTALGQYGDKTKWPYADTLGMSVQET